MSALADAFKRIWWEGDFPICCMAYSRRRNGLPGRTTLVANWSIPTKLCNSLLVNDLV